MPTNSTLAAHADEEYTLPGVEALLAGTLALMTGLAQTAPEAAHQGPMTRKIVENLGLLAEHAQLSPTMRLMLRRLIGHWQRAGRSAPAGEAAAPRRSAAPAPLWAPVPPRLQ